MYSQLATMGVQCQGVGMHSQRGRLVQLAWRHLPVPARRNGSYGQALAKPSGQAPSQPWPWRGSRRFSAGSDVGSSSDILAGSLARLYHEVQNPANRPYSKAIAEFTAKAILAYECGYSEDSLREQIEQLVRDEQLSHLQGFEAAACTEFISLVWLTLMLAPRSVKRWATTPAVSGTTSALWQGFVRLIVVGYVEGRMAWYPLDRLALEINAVQGRSEAQEVVAERARVVFTALEATHPQFPSD